MKIIEGDITEIKKGIIVHQVNCWGVMGAGLAKQIKDKFPEAFHAYKLYVHNYYKTSFLGDIVTVNVGEKLWICNAFTQIPGNNGLRRGEVTCLESIQKAFSKINQIDEVVDGSLQVYVPYNYGCGIASGNWEDVSKAILEACPSVIFVRLPQ